MDTPIVSGFPGVGKSTVFNNRAAYSIPILDSDSSTFDKEFFPQNYIQHIRQEVTKGNLILVSSHGTVRDALEKQGFVFHLVYPDRSLKMEYLNRYSERGSPASFCDMMYHKWGTFIDECEKQTGCTRTVLRTGQYMADCPEIQKYLISSAA